MTDPTASTTPLPLTSAHRVIRRLADGEGPIAGALVTDGEAVRVWSTEADAVDGRFLGAEHVLTPVDFARSDDGGGALLPWCTHRAGVYLARRSAAGEPLSAGEWATMLGSALRGLAEILRFADAHVRGTWWITAEGRPVFAVGPGPAVLEAVEAIASLAVDDAVDRGLRRIAEQIRDGVTDSTPPAARIERWESELCDFAAPRPLRLDPPGAEYAMDAADAGRAANGVPRLRVRDRRPLDLRGLGQRLAERLPGAGRHRASADDDSRPRRAACDARRPVRGLRWVRKPSTSKARGRTGAQDAPPRRRLVLVGAVAAGAVVIGGLLWPDGGSTDAEGVVIALRGAVVAGSTSITGGAGEASAPERPSTTLESSPAPEPPSASEPSASEPSASEPSTKAHPSPESVQDQADALAAVPGLLEVLDDCAGDVEGVPAGCAALASGSSARPEDVLRSEDAGKPTLVDDYGDLAVIRIGGAEEQMLVLVRQNEKWLVRDAYDVADQP